MTRRVIMADEFLPEEVTISKLGSFVHWIKTMDGCSCRYSLTNQQLTVFVGEPGTLNGAPAGTHEFAEGWLAHKRVCEINEEMIGMGIDGVDWREVEINTDDMSVRQIKDPVVL